MKKCAIYTRVSTLEQAEEGYSLNAQKEKLEAYANSMGLAVMKSYSDPGYSGSNLNRPGLTNLLRDLELYDYVLVYKLDRLSRSQKDTLTIIEEYLDPAGVGMISLTESFDTTTPFGRAVIGMLSVFAQLERENIMERHIMGKRKKAQEGGYNGGMVPWGYDFVDGQFVQNENSKYVRLAFDMYLEGHGTPAIQKKIPHKSKGQIRSWLQAPSHAGMVKFRDILTEANFIPDPIVTWDEFCKVQDLLDSRRMKTRGPVASRNPLAGLCHCDNCGALMTRRASTLKHEYLTCYSRIKTAPEMIKDEECKAKHHRLEDIVNAVRSEVDHLQYDTELFKRLTGEEQKPLFVDYKSELKGLTAKIEKLLDLHLEGALDKKLYMKKSKELEKKVHEIKRLELEQSSKINKNLSKSYETLSESWDDMDNIQRNAFLKILIDDIKVKDDAITIEWAF